FLTPEADRLLGELCCERTDHARREAIGMRLSEIGDPRPGVGVVDGVPDILWCTVPPGEVEIKDHGRFAVRPFQIAAYPVTYAQYRAFLDAEDGYRSDRWWENLKKEAEPGQQLRPYASYPADHVSWWDATAFCRWLSHCTGQAVRLPDEWEWQWAAQSARAGFGYPWGSDWVNGFANTIEADIGRTTAVGMYPGGRSAQGVYDLAGNVWEWCCIESENRTKTEQGGDESHGVRGGSWLNDQDFARAVSRGFSDPRSQYGVSGFRVLCASPIR
ncbi:MAG: SUMF1/EgtB/PvdO family nonheme iron enzyme, partial [Thiohalocapsa sp.]